MMTKICSIVLSISILMIVGSSCGNINSKSEFHDTDTITFNKLVLQDSISENNVNNCSYSISCSVVIDMPIDKKIRNIFCKNVLALSADSTLDSELVSQYLSNQFNEFGIRNDDESDNNIGDEGDCLSSKNHRYSTIISITPKYNKNGIITFQKNERTIRDGQLTMLTNTYFSFNTIENEPIFINNIFDENDISEITQMLKDQLKRQLKVNDENALYEMGYFNMDNIIANNNFEITDEGITWNFLPYEIACYSIGETRITLPYSFISQYINDNSILSQFKQTN